MSITGFKVEDLRFPTSLSGDGTDAMNRDCDYSAAYVTLNTDKNVAGSGMTFTIGRGNDIVCMAVTQVAEKLVGRSLPSLLDNMGASWDYLLSDPQFRWIGPEKGVIHIAIAAVVNALWDLKAKLARKPLWRLIVDMTPEEFVQSTSFRYISDAITKEEALTLLKEKEKTKQERIDLVTKIGYPAYTTSVGWIGYSDEKVIRLTKEAIAQGFNHFKVKVGISVENDLQRLRLVRSVIDDPANFANREKPDPATIEGKNAGPTGAVLMVDANQVWDVPQAIEWMKQLEEIKPWFIEEPTAPDDILGHARIRKELKPYGIGVATGEHAHNRMVFKQLLQADAIDVVQIDSCRVAGVNEILAILLMAAKFGKIVNPHAGGVGLCEYVIHLSLIDYICVSGSMTRNVLEYVDHLHEHFPNKCTINPQGRYNVPQNPDEGYSIDIYEESKATYRFPDGKYWSSEEAKKAHGLK
ncbi:mandelate racemase/muconate lactonizing enzyme [Atractiella rhizophila]|nr:mandelate racemase/muconate lactonizing enzyme [Atractiella rhizophila]